MAMRSGAVARWAIGASGIALACSLQMPDEEELFGRNNAAGRGGNTAGMDGESGRPGAGVGGGGGSIAPSDAGASGEAGAGAAGGEAGSRAGGSTGGSKSGTGGSVSVMGGAGGAIDEEPGGAGGEAGTPPLVDFDPLEGLVAHYRFDDGAGTVVADEVTPPRDGTIIGSTTWVPNGKIGGALRLSGQQAYVDIPNGIMLPLEEITISVWFNKDHATLWQRLFDFGSSERNWFYYAPNAAAALTGELGSRAAVDVTDTITVELHMPQHVPLPGKWNHVVLTWTQTDFYVYLNGVEAGHDADPIVTPGGHESMTPVGQTWHNWIGRSNFTVDPYYMGMVDDFRVYNRALSGPEVRALNAVAE